MNKETDALYLKAGLEELESYLLSREVYWPLGSSSLPQLTLGNLLLSRLRLKVRGLLSTAEEARLEEQHHRWRAAWEKKAQQEFRSRLRLWQNYLEDYSETPSAFASDYPQEVRHRAILELLQAEMAAPLPQAALLQQLDDHLRAVFIPGPFLWEADLQPAFPQETWWYLYGRLKG
jgi:hypothetical protein